MTPRPGETSTEVEGARVAIVAGPTLGNRELLEGLRAAGIRAELVPPSALADLQAGDIVLGRLDVLRTLDGVEPGLPSLRRAARAGFRVLNRPSTLLAAHDKLLTATILRRSGIEHPPTLHLVSAGPAPLEFPFVVKPRYGSWGRSVILCRTEAEYRDCLRRIRARSWFTRHGALVQALVPYLGRDLRIIVAGGEVVGASARIARAGEWRTNVSLGGHLEAAEVPAEARRLAVAAAAAIRGDLVGVDLLPTATGHIVLELNGAVDFDHRYTLPGRPLYSDIARALALPTGTGTLENAGHAAP